MTISSLLFHCHFEETDSTNTQAKQWLRANQDKPGVVVTADRQTAGRGSHGRQWVSTDDGGLYYTLGLRGAIAGDDWVRRHEITRLPFDVATLCQTVLRAHGVEVAIEWPNDLILKDKKVGGILVECGHWVHGSPAHVMIGIGLNVNQPAFPDWIQAVAISMWQVDGVYRSKKNIQNDLTKELLAWL